MSSEPPENALDPDKLKDETSSAIEKVRSEVENLKTVQQIENDVLEKRSLN